jgi:hypothetical protein
MTAPAMPDLDTQLLEEITVPCEAKTLDAQLRITARCDQPATWIVRTTCHCGHVENNLWCQPHYEQLTGTSAVVFICDGCGCRDRHVDRRAERL